MTQSKPRTCWLRSAALVGLSIAVSGCGAIGMLGVGVPTSNFGGHCEWEEGFGGGTEDLVATPAGDVYVSADPRRGEGGRGGIWLVRRLQNGVVTKEEVTGGSPAIFHPHGIALWRGVGGNRLFVINHAQARLSQVEVYDIDESGRLIWAPGETSQALKRPNDLVAVGPRAYYVTRDHHAEKSAKAGRLGPAELIENLMGLPIASVLYVEDGKPEPAVGGLAFPAGIAASADNQTIFVSETTTGRITAFERKADNTLTRTKSYRVGPMPDNLTMAPDGLWFGAHSRLLAWLQHFGDPSKPSPGRVGRLDIASGDSPTMLRQDGVSLSMLSVGAPLGDEIIIGSIDQHKVGFCRRANTVPESS
jgi:arylesterase / paraoxonase